MWRHVLVRVALLWFLGGLVQGEWTSLDPMKIAPYSNTLQAIAVGYLAAAAVACVPSRAFAICVTVGTALGYSLLLALGGDYSQFGNFAFKVENAIRTAIYPAGHVRLLKPSYYTWFLTSLMFVSMTMCGMHASQLLRTGWTWRRKTIALFAYAAGLLALGFGVLPWIPCIKPIYTLSFTALAMGVCVSLLAVLYVVNDVLGFKRGWGFVVFFGRMALAAYFMSHFLGPVFNAAAELLGGGVCRYLPNSARPFTIRLFSIACLVAAMVIWRYAKRGFSKDRGRGFFGDRPRGSDLAAHRRREEVWRDDMANLIEAAK